VFNKQKLGYCGWKVFYIGVILCALYINLIRLFGNQEYGVLKESPVNPEFLKYLQDVKEGKQTLLTPEGYWLGHIPPPVDLGYLTGQTIFPALQGYPTYYDLRTQGKLTSVKNQGACGSCWSFASYGSLESYLMPAANWDFAEQDMIDHHGFDNSPCAGGNYFMSSAYLARWAGPVLETDDPYIYANLDGLTVRKHVQDVIFLPGRANYLDNDNIKWAVMTYGAAYISFYWSSSYFNSSTNSYYCNTAYNGNHAVAVVGWDDNYDKNKFNTIPPGNGAFILKNSWGSSWGESGYFYLSYYDASFQPGAAFTAEPTTNYTSVYQYDPLGWVTSFGYGTNTAWGANIFTATASDYLKAVSVYATSANASYELYIYTNVTTGSPRSGTLSATKTGTLSNPGYHTIILTTPVSLTSGQIFSLVVKFQTPGYNYPIPNERYYSGYSSGATSNPGESFISYDGTSWTDVSADTYYKRNICIKGFTGLSSPPVTISGNVRTADGSGLSGVTMDGLPTNPLTAGDGTYSDLVASGWTGTVMPSKSGYTMSPPSRSYTNVIANQTGQDYTAGVGTCTYSISSTGQSFPSSGGTSDEIVTTQSGCSWTATSNDSWITITSGSSGTGSGTVSYSVSANAGSISRTGTMLIAGLTFTVSQAGTRSDNSPGNYQILPECIWAPATGGGTWISEVQITDLSGGSVVSAYFNYGGGGRRGPIAVWTNSGGANRSNKFSNFLSTLQSLDSGFTYYGLVGTVEFSTQDSSHLIQVVARTLNGNYSKTFPGFNLTDSNTADTTRKMMIQNYTNNATYRSTCGFFNPTSDSLTVEFRLLNSSGNLIGSAFTKTFVGYDFKAFSPFNEAGIPYPTYSCDNVFLLINPISGTGKLMCFGASANNITNDPAAHITVQYQ
jgi:C1A family cysteine protease